jgi:hypothetical protein
MIASRGILAAGSLFALLAFAGAQTANSMAPGPARPHNAKADASQSAPSPAARSPHTPPANTLRRHWLRFTIIFVAAALAVIAALVYEHNEHGPIHVSSAPPPPLGSQKRPAMSTAQAAGP